MTHHPDNTLLELICELLDEYGFDGLAEAVTLVLNEAMKVGMVSSAKSGEI